MLFYVYIFINLKQTAKESDSLMEQKHDVRDLLYYGRCENTFGLLWNYGRTNLSHRESLYGLCVLTPIDNGLHVNH